MSRKKALYQLSRQSSLARHRRRISAIVYLSAVRNQAQPKKRLRLNYVCFASRRRRFDPGHVHQLFLIAKHLPASATQSVGADLRARRGWRAVIVEGIFPKA